MVTGNLNEQLTTQDRKFLDLLTKKAKLVYLDGEAQLRMSLGKDTSVVKRLIGKLESSGFIKTNMIRNGFSNHRQIIILPQTKNLK